MLFEESHQSERKRRERSHVIVGSLEKNLDIRSQRSLEDRRGLVGKSIAFLQEGAGGSENTMAVISVPLSDSRSKGATAGVVRNHRHSSKDKRYSSRGG